MGTTYVHLSHRLYSVPWEEAFSFEIYFFSSRADIFPFFIKCKMSLSLWLKKQTRLHG